MSENDIFDVVEDVAQQINVEYADKDILVVCVLQGAVLFFSDLLRQLTSPRSVQTDFVRVASYRGTTSSFTPQLYHWFEADTIRNKDVLLIEDIVDSGASFSLLYQAVEAQKPKSLRLCTLLARESSVVSLQQCKSIIGVTVFVPDFVVGYGMDYNGLYRNLPAIYLLGKDDSRS